LALWLLAVAYPSRVRGGALFYRHLCSRMDKPDANTTAHKLARIVFFMLTRGEDLVDQGQWR